MRKKFVLLAAVVFTFGAMLLVMLSCSSPTSPLSPSGKSGISAQGLQLVVTATKGGGNVTFTIGVENSGSATQTLQFGSAQFFDIEVKDHLGNLVWRWSNDKVFATVMLGIDLAPGESSSQTAEWDLIGNNGQRVFPETYTAKIYITSSPRDEALVVEIPLTI